MKQFDKSFLRVNKKESQFLEVFLRIFLPTMVFFGDVSSSTSGIIIE